MSPYHGPQFIVGVVVSRVVLESGFTGAEIAQLSSLLQGIPFALLQLLQLLQHWHLIHNPASEANVEFLNGLYS